MKGCELYEPDSLYCTVHRFDLVDAEDLFQCNVRGIKLSPQFGALRFSLLSGIYKQGILNLQMFQDHLGFETILVFHMPI